MVGREGSGWAPSVRICRWARSRLWWWNAWASNCGACRA